MSYWTWLECDHSRVTSQRLQTEAEKEHYLAIL